MPPIKRRFKQKKRRQDNEWIVTRITPPPRGQIYSLNFQTGQWDPLLGHKIETYDGLLVKQINEPLINTNIQSIPSWNGQLNHKFQEPLNGHKIQSSHYPLEHEQWNIPQPNESLVDDNRKSQEPSYSKKIESWRLQVQEDRKQCKIIEKTLDSLHQKSQEVLDGHKIQSSHYPLEHEQWNIPESNESLVDENHKSEQPLDGQKLETSIDAIKVPKQNILDKTKAKCDICGTVLQKQSIARHKQTVHSNKNQHKCSYCDVTFSRDDGLRRHLKNYHQNPTSSEAQLYNCDQCSAKFSTSRHLATHKRIHATQTYECNTCGKKFGNEALLAKHKCLKACDICGEMYVNTHTCS